MQWNNNMTVGNSKIDNQHKKLFDTLKNHFDACMQGKGSEEVINTLSFLAKYVVIHFRDEEEYMAENNYPDLDKHKAIHKAFLDEVSSIIETVNKEGVSSKITIDVNRKLKNWLVDHIMKVDKEYYHYIQDNSK